MSQILVDRSNIDYPARVPRGNPGRNPIPNDPTGPMNPPLDPRNDPGGPTGPNPNPQYPQTTSGDWIRDALNNAQSTDDYNYWLNVINAHNDFNNQNARAYWIDRINRGNGSMFVRNGTLAPYGDNSMGGNLSSLLSLLGINPQNQGNQPYDPHAQRWQPNQIYGGQFGQPAYTNPNQLQMGAPPSNLQAPTSTNGTMLGTQLGNQQNQQNQFNSGGPSFMRTGNNRGGNIPSNFQYQPRNWFGNQQSPMGAPSFYNQPNSFNGQSYGGQSQSYGQGNVAPMRQY